VTDHERLARTGDPPDSYGAKPKQPVKEFAALYEQAAEPGTLDALTESGQTITGRLKERYPGLFDDVEFSQGPLKAWDRSVVKLLGDIGNIVDPAKGDKVVDLVRGRIIIDNAGQVRAIREILADDELRKELGIEYAKDRFAKPSDTHYRDINMSIRLPNGHIAEIQVNQRDMLAAAEFTHDPYEDADAIRKRAQIRGEKMTVNEARDQKRLKNYAQDVHNRGAARFEGADELLNEAGRAKLDADFAARRAADPAYEPGRTVQTGHKYDAMLVDGAPPIDRAEAYGGAGAKELRKQAGIEVNGIRARELDLSLIVNEFEEQRMLPRGNVSHPGRERLHKVEHGAGKAAGAAGIVVDIASGDYGAAAVGVAAEAAMSKSVLQAAESSASVAGSALKHVVKRIPVIGAAVTAGFAAVEVGGHLLNGDGKKALAAAAAGGAEAAGNLVGFGVGDAAREAVREGVIAVGGDEYKAIEKSGLRQLGEKGTELISGNFNRNAAGTPAQIASIQSSLIAKSGLQGIERDGKPLDVDAILRDADQRRALLSQLEASAQRASSPESRDNLTKMLQASEEYLALENRRLLLASSVKREAPAATSQAHDPGAAPVAGSVNRIAAPGEGRLALARLGRSLPSSPSSPG